MSFRLSNAAVVLQTLIALMACLPLCMLKLKDGELLQEGDLQRACAAGRPGLGREGQEEVGVEGGQLLGRIHARRRCGLGLEC